MDYAIRVILNDVPLAAKIWLLLIVGSFTAFFILSNIDYRAMPAVRNHRCRRLRRSGSLRWGCAAKLAGDDPAEDVRYAEEVAVAARRSADTAARHKQEWTAAVSAVDISWHGYEQAAAAVRRLVEASVYRVPDLARTPAEYADREQQLHRMARDAYERGELSAEQLRAALANQDAFDPRLHPVEQELVLRRAVRDHLLQCYLMASTAERRAWQAADVAAAAYAALSQEAFVAAEQVRNVRQPRPIRVPWRRSGARLRTSRLRLAIH